MGCHDGEKIQGFWLNVYLGHPYSKTGFQPTDAIYRLVWYGTQEKKNYFGRSIGSEKNPCGLDVSNSILWSSS